MNGAAPRPAGQHGQHGQRGFALVEVLIAALILAAMLGVYFDSADASLSAERRIADRRAAALVARSALDGASTPGDASPRTRAGRSGRFSWAVRVTPWSGAPDAVAAATAGGGLALQRVEVTVTADGEVRPLLTLATLRLAQ